MATSEAAGFPTYSDLMYPVLRAVATLGGSAKGSEITEQVVEDLGLTEADLAVSYDNNPKSILLDRIAWARSYNKLGGALESPRRSLFLLTSAGKEALDLPEAEARQLLRDMDRAVRADRPKGPRKPPTAAVLGSAGEAPDIAPEEPDGSDDDWKQALLSRLHKLSPDGFEEFVLYLLRTYGLELTRIGGSGDEGVDGIGLAPISDVLSSRVAVQAKKYDPNGPSPISRDVVALFQRDAAAARAERAILVTLSRFSGPARRAAIITQPTVDLIDGDRLCELVEKQGVGVRSVTTVDERWFDRFD